MEGKTGILTFGDGTTAKIEVVKKQTYNTMPSDYWLKYAEGETNKQIIHSDYGKKEGIESEILLPSFIFNDYVKLD